MGETPPAWLWPRGAYIHVPFCRHHCGYCDFAVVTGKDHLIQRYIDALALELATLGEPRPVKSIFIGGGTPSYLDVDQLERLIRNIVSWLPLEKGHEFSVEANPESLDESKMSLMTGWGVNRVSLGAQSFHPRLLRVLERDHDPEGVGRGVECVKKSGAHVSLDLIFGIPGQTEEEWHEDLHNALAWKPDHLSTYGLTFEKGTRLWKQQQAGAVRALDEEKELAMYSGALDVLEAAGYRQYEISSHALPGRECRHNQIYWANEAYFGFGMGAARYVWGRRELNTRDLTSYLSKIGAGESAAFQVEELPQPERARETIALNLRRAEGIDRRRFQWQTGFKLDDLIAEPLARHVEMGLLEDDGERVCLTRAGKYVADSVIENLM